MDTKALGISLLYMGVGFAWITFLAPLVDGVGTADALGATLWGDYLWLAISGGTIYGGVHYLRSRLHSNRVQYRQFFGNNPQPMLIFEPPSGQILAANRAAERCYGYSEAEFRKLRLVDLEAKAPRRERFVPNASVDSSFPPRFIRHLNRRAQSFAVKVSTHDIDYQGVAARLMLIAEVEDLLRNEQQIRALNQQLTEFRFAISRATIMATLDQEGCFQEVNENFLRTTGWAKTALLQERFSVTLEPTDAQAHFETILSALQNHRIWRGELAHRTREGNDLWTQSYFIPFIQPNGQFTHAILIYTDITEQKKSEEETLRREKYLRSLIESQSNYLIRTDVAGRFTFVNRQFEQKFGFLSDDFIGTDSLETVAEADHAACHQMAMTCLANPGKIVALPLRKPHPEGGYYYTDWEFVGIPDEQGEVTEVQGIGQDATGRVRSQRHILDQNRRLREIAWLSSHELRRPVANMIGLLDLVKATEVGQHELIDPLETSVLQLDQLIRDIVQRTYEVEEDTQPPPEPPNT